MGNRFCGRFVCVCRTRFLPETENTRAFRTRTVDGGARKTETKSNNNAPRYAKRPGLNYFRYFIIIRVIEFEWIRLEDTPTRPTIPDNALALFPLITVFSFLSYTAEIALVHVIAVRLRGVLPLSAPGVISLAPSDVPYLLRRVVCFLASVPDPARRLNLP